MDHTKIGQLIRRLRREQGLTQRQLAEEMGISDKTVSKWERGMGCPDLSLLPELSDIFHVGLDQLLTGELEAREALGTTSGRKPRAEGWRRHSPKRRRRRTALRWRRWKTISLSHPITPCQRTTTSPSRPC